MTSRLEEINPVDNTATSSAPPPAPSNGSPRSVWLALVVISAVLVGTAAGLLAFAGGVDVPGAVLTGGAAFAGTVLLLLAMLNFASGKSG